MSDFDAIIDSDVLVSAFVEQDAHHERAINGFNILAQSKARLVITNYIVSEIATVLVRLTHQDNIQRFLAYMQSGALPVIYPDRDNWAASLELFKAQERKVISIFDCSNVVIMRQYEIPKIFAFDDFYYKQLGLHPAV